MNFLAKLIFGDFPYTKKMTDVLHGWEAIDKKYCPVCGDKNAPKADFCSEGCAYQHYSEKDVEGG